MTISSTKTASPGAPPAEGRPAFWAAALLSLVIFAAGNFSPGRETARPRAAAEAVYAGRVWRLPAERNELLARMRESGKPRACLRMAPGAGAERLACADNQMRWAWGLPLDLNRATTEELERIPAVGRKLAERIAGERERRGRFAGVEEMGRGLKLLPETEAALRQWLVVEEESQEGDEETGGPAH